MINWLQKLILLTCQACDHLILRNSLFCAVKSTKNADPGKYSYSGYGIWTSCLQTSF